MNAKIGPCAVDVELATIARYGLDDRNVNTLKLSFTPKECFVRLTREPHVTIAANRYLEHQMH